MDDTDADMRSADIDVARLLVRAFLGQRLFEVILNFQWPEDRCLRTFCRSAADRFAAR
jgi:hypothetical protein